MDAKSYIESGVLELYALGLLDENERTKVAYELSVNPNLQQEYEAVQHTLEKFAFINRITPRSDLKEKIVDCILNLQKEKEISIDDLPLINRYSSHLNWLKLVDGLGDLPMKNGRYVKRLFADEKVSQFLIVSETDIEQEVHRDEQESFLILSGTCECHIDGEVSLMKAGDFMEIPLYKPHEVLVLQKPVCAILQLVKC